MKDKVAYSIDEAAAAIGLSRASIYVLISKGDLKAKKIGRRTIIMDQELRSLLDRLDVQPVERLTRHRAA